MELAVELKEAIVLAEVQENAIGHAAVQTDAVEQAEAHENVMERAEVQGDCMGEAKELELEFHPRIQWTIPMHKSVATSSEKIKIVAAGRSGVMQKSAW